MKIFSIRWLLVSLPLICPSIVMPQDKMPQAKDDVKRVQKEINEQDKRQKNELKQRARTPFVVTLDASPDQLKAALIPMLTTQGYILETDTPFQLTFWTELTGNRAFWATMFLGNQYSETPRETVQFLFSPTNGTTTLTSHVEVSVKMALGKVNRVSLDHNANMRGELEAIADQLKRSVVVGSDNPSSPIIGAQNTDSKGESIAYAHEIPDATKDIEASTERVVALALENLKREQISLYALDPTIVIFRRSDIDLGIYDIDLRLQKTARGVQIDAYTYRILTTAAGTEMRIEAFDFPPTIKTHTELGAYLQRLLDEIKVMAESTSIP